MNSLHDTVAESTSALDVLGESALAQIARELGATMRRAVKTDWTVREDVRAKLRSSLKWLLIKYDPPPDKRAGAVAGVIEQMETMTRRQPG